MSFGHPWLLFALAVPLAAAGLWIWLDRRPARHPVSFTNLDVLAAVTESTRSWRRWVAPALFLGALCLLGAALARPHATTTVTDERATVILVIDASRSMQSDDVKPTRLIAAENAAREFLARVPKRLRVALIVFSGDVQVAAPPTTDHELVGEAIDDIGGFTGFGGTAIGDAIARAVTLGRDAVDARTRGLVSVVFLSDGRQNRGILPPLEGAARAKRAGIPVYTIALGTRGGGLVAPPGGGFGFGFGNRAPDPRTLRAIARATGGRFYQAKSAGAVKRAYASLGSHLGRRPGRTEVTYAFVLAGALLAAGAVAASARWSSRIP